MVNRGVIKKKVVYVTNMPQPYREQIHQRVSEQMNGNYHVIYCYTREPDRLWDINPGAYSRSFLKKSFITLKNRPPDRTMFIHVNFDIWSELNRLDPQVVITTGYNPTFLFALLWCLVKRRKHIVFTDGWLKSEENLSWVHVLIRKIVFRLSSAFLGASQHTLDLFRHYGCPEKALFLSYLCADNDTYKRFVGAEKKYDILFSGQFIKRKMPLFFVEVARLLKAKMPNLRVLLLGDGPDRESVLEALRTAGVNFTYMGYLSQAELPAHYASSKIFLFPTVLDPWGVVANEACAVGVPVITCSNPGAANELVIHGYNGFVLDLDPKIWCEHVLKLLRDKSQWDTFSRNALEKVQEFNYNAAAEGIVKAAAFLCRVEVC
jgi:glycosyltransferase involved in cell wall biosynthesis